MSRKDDSPAISLFSFQDIITSITGIMFLVVILLILLFLESESQKNDTAPDQAAIRDITAQIANLEETLIQSRQREKDLEKTLKELQAMSLETIEKRKKELAEEIARKQNELRQNQTANNEMKNSIANTEHEIKNLKEKISALKEAVEKERKSVTSNRKMVEELKKQAKSSSNAVTFSVEKDSDKNFILAEFGKDGFRVKDFNNQKDYDLRSPGNSDVYHIENFLKWLKQRQNDNEVISVILIPSKIKLWNIIADKLRNAKFDFGVEFYPNDDGTIFIDIPGGGE